MSGKDRFEAYLQGQHVRFEPQHHSQCFTAQEVAASEHVPGRMVAKAVMVVADGRPAILLVPAPRQVDLGRAAAALRAKEVRLAREQEFFSLFPDCEPGAVPPFGNLYHVPVWIDRALAQQKELVVEAGTHTDTLKLSYSDYERSVHPAIAELARPSTSLHSVRR